MGRWGDISRVAGIAIAVGVMLAASGESVAGPAGMALHDTPRQLPEIGFTDEMGLSHSLESYQGQIVLLNVWATWCGPCRREMPTLDRLQARLGSDRFEVVALSVDRGGIAAVREFYADIGARKLALLNDSTRKSARKLTVLGIPTTVLVGPDGRELARRVGPVEWDSPETVEFLQSVIDDYAAGRSADPDQIETIN